MLSTHIKIGDRVEISLKKDKAAGKSYVSLVENKLNNTDLVLDVPISLGQLVLLKPGEGYWLMFFTDKGMYGYDAKILGHFKEDGFNLMKVKLTSQGQKVQRRDFYRYECFLPLKFSVIPESVSQQNDAEKPKLVLHDGMMVDVSGGGMRFEANQDISEGKMIKCAFKLGDTLISSNGKILKKDIQENNRHKFVYRVQFVKISLDDQESIIKFIFMEQRKLLGRI